MKARLVIVSWAKFTGVLVCVLGWLSMPTALAAIDLYEFDTPVQEARFTALIAELRCPKCQNQNIADSDAMIAKDIKSRVPQLIGEGKSDSEITAYMVDRYGDFVTYRPPLKPVTYLLWFGPPIAFIVAVIVILVRVSMRAKTVAPAAEPDAQRVQDILARYSGDDEPDRAPKSTSKL